MSWVALRKLQLWSPLWRVQEKLKGMATGNLIVMEKGDNNQMSDLGRPEFIPIVLKCQEQLCLSTEPSE